MTGLGSLVCALLAAASVHAEQPPRSATSVDEPAEAWVSVSGSGLFSLPDTATQKPRSFSVGASVDNHDRDPTRLDALDLSVAWTYGIKSGFETYGHAVVSRSVIVADRPTLLPPPLDIIVPQGVPAPGRHDYPVYEEFPYVSRSGSSQVYRFVPGDAMFGMKLVLRRARGAAPGFAVSGELKLPLARDLPTLQSGAGTGGFDQTLKTTAEWRTRRQSFVASLGFTHVGQPPFGDRLIRFTPGGSAESTDLPLSLANRLSLGAGIRHLMTKRAAVVLEAIRVIEIGHRTTAIEAPGPLDLTGGAQFRWSRLQLTLGLRYHANSIPALAARPSSLGGFADLTGVADAALRSYLAQIGATDALRYLPQHGQIALAFPASGPPLPEGARILPADFVLRSHDRVGYVFVWGWSFGGNSPRKQ